MRKLWFAGVAGAALLAGPAAVADATSERSLAELLQDPPICGEPNRAEDVNGAPVADMVMVEGIGSDAMVVDGTPEAQAWFNYGMQLRWAFQHTESVRAFQKARLLDPSCAMCAWGEAWAMGPNLNGGGNEPTVAPAALKLARDARRNARVVTPVQRQMMDALIQRYSGRENSRGARYARAMERLADRNPADVQIATMAADADMLAAEDWWNEDGSPKDRRIAKAMSLLEGALARSPDAPGAIHLYIHLTEWSADPHKAIPYGERLAALTPGASHLVHMPSHTFYRVGRYKDAMASNVNAVALDLRYEELARPPGGVKGMPLHGHNIHFGMGGALMAGGAEDGLKLADWFLKTYPDIPADNAWRQAMANNAYALYGRFGTAAQIAALEQPPESHPMLRISWHYARGEAAARRGDAAAVRAEAEAIAALREGRDWGTGWEGEMKADFTEISQKVLEGRAAMIAGDADAAIAAYGRAAEIQGKGEEGGDPPIVWYPTRRSLAAAMLLKGDAAGAKAKIEELLEDWPSDPYSYFILARAETALGDREAAAEATRKSRVEWIGGEMKAELA